jgi:hypothetical protein
MGIAHVAHHRHPHVGRALEHRVDVAWEQRVVGVEMNHVLGIHQRQRLVACISQVVTMDVDDRSLVRD